MGTEILTFGDIEIEEITFYRKKIHRYKDNKGHRY